MKRVIWQVFTFILTMLYFRVCVGLLLLSGCATVNTRNVDNRAFDYKAACGQDDCGKDSQ